MPHRPDEAAVLHDPGPDTDGPTDAEDPELAALQKKYRGTWVIWRSLTAQRTPGEWCAHRVHTEQAPTGLSAPSAQELAARIAEAAQ